MNVGCSQLARRIALILLGVLPVSCSKADPPPPAASGVVVLKLDGLAGSKSLTLDQIKVLPATQGWAGVKTRSGKIVGPEPYKGVSLVELAGQVGGMGPGMEVTITAKDGYAVTLSYDEIAKGEFMTYDPRTGNEVKVKTPPTVIVAYEKSGHPLNEETEGALKLAFVGEKNEQVVDSPWSVKWVERVAFKKSAKPRSAPDSR